MKAILITLFLTSFSACAGIENLNNRIYEAQERAVLQSPYKSANGTSAYIEAQKDFRSNKLPKLLKSRIYKSDPLKDPILITESFDATCINCSSYWMKVLLKDTVYSVRGEIMGHRGGFTYKMATEPFNPHPKDHDYELRNCDLIEIVGKIRSGLSWNSFPLQFGADNCNDGDHTISTVIYPDRKIEAMYVRCCIPSFYRNRR